MFKQRARNENLTQSDPDYLGFDWRIDQLEGKFNVVKKKEATFDPRTWGTAPQTQTKRGHMY